MTIAPIDPPTPGQFPWAEDLNADLLALNGNLQVINNQIGDIDQSVIDAQQAASDAEDAADRAEAAALEGIFTDARLTHADPDSLVDDPYFQRFPDSWLIVSGSAAFYTPLVHPEFGPGISFSAGGARRLDGRASDNPSGGTALGFPVRAGEVLTAGVYVDNSGNTTNSLIRIRFATMSGSFATQIQAASLSAGGSGWIEGQVTVPANAAYARISLDVTGTPTGPVVFCRPQIRRVPAITPPDVEGIPGLVNAGDYLTDSGNQTQNFLDALAQVEDGGTLVVPHGEYRFDNEAYIPVDREMTIDFQGSTILNGTSSSSVLNFVGDDFTWESPVSVQSVAVGTISPSGPEDWISSETPSTTLTFPLGTTPPSSWQRGDTVKVVSDDPIPGARNFYSTTDTRRARMGQHLQVYSVEGRQVILLGHLREWDAYTENIRAAKMVGKQVVLRNMKISMSDAGWAVEDASRKALTFTGLYNPVVENILVERSQGGTIQFANCYRYTARDIEINMTRNRLSGDANHIATYGYGIIDTGSELGWISNYFSKHTRHAFTDDATRYTIDGSNPPPSTVRAYGRTFGTTIVDSTNVGSSSASWDTHAHGDSVSFINCASYGSHAGFSLRGIRHRVINGFVQDAVHRGISTQDESAQGPGWSWGHVVDGLVVDGAQHIIRVSRNASAADTDEVITDEGGRVISGPYGRRIEVADTFKNITGRRIRGHGIYALNTTLVVENISYERISFDGVSTGNGYEYFQNSSVDIRNYTHDMSRVDGPIDTGRANFYPNTGTFLAVDGFRIMWDLTRDDPGGILYNSGQDARLTNGRVSKVLTNTLNNNFNELDITPDATNIPGIQHRLSTPPPFTSVPEANYNPYRNAFSDTGSDIVFVFNLSSSATLPRWHRPVRPGQRLTVFNDGSTITVPDDTFTSNSNGANITLASGESAQWVATGQVWRQVV